MKEKSKKISFVIIVLIGLIIGLVGYIVFDKTVVHQWYSKVCVNLIEESSNNINNLEDFKNNDKNYVKEIGDLSVLLSTEELKESFDLIKKEKETLKISYKCTSFDDINITNEVYKKACTKTDITINDKINYSNFTEESINECSENNYIYLTDKYIIRIFLEGCLKRTKLYIYNNNGELKYSNENITSNYIKEDGSTEDLFPIFSKDRIYFVEIANPNKKITDINDPSAILNLSYINLSKDNLEEVTSFQFNGIVEYE